MDSYRYEMSLAGQKFKLKTTEDKDYLDSLVEFVNDRIEEIANQGVTSTTRCAVLAAFYITDELFKLKNSKPDGVKGRYYAKKLESLVKRIDSAIKEK